MKLALLLLVIALLSSCGKTKVEIYDKCLNQANSTFKDDIENKAKFLNGCMVEKGYAWNKGCAEMTYVDMLSSICYREDR